MIASITGQLHHLGDDRAFLRVGPVLCEVMVPAADIPTLHGQLGGQLTFHTLLYLEGDAGGGNSTPRLLGFLRPEDKKFFELFITVKNIGPRKALRALAAPVGQIARAIEHKDTKFLVELPQIGRRIAEQIVAELSGKVDEFVSPGSAPGRPSAAAPRPDAEEDAIAALVQLGERRSDAEQLLERAKLADPAITTTNAFVREMLRLRG
ncbi:MAG TPA: Holliday junction branch migration protein RuvA [Tepidisphaeraceae bacterium]|jgi:Holliday junction DNA helicase RuvA|nr:Holliday junction branch migration protein RuvA [Tepidisphaeraceae bacterium]